MKCQSCGKTISDSAKFCPYCGFDLEAATDSQELYSNCAEKRIDEEYNRIENEEKAVQEERVTEDYSDGYTQPIGDGSNYETRVFDRVDTGSDAPYAPDDIDEYGNEKSKKNRKVLAAVIIIAAILITAIIIFAAVVFGRNCGGDASVPAQTSSIVDPTAPTTSDSLPVEIPSLVGLQQSEAERQLEELGLEANISEQSSYTVEQGIVISQSPEPGDTVHRGTSVTLYVSTGSDEDESSSQTSTQAPTQASTEPVTEAQTQPDSSSSSDSSSDSSSGSGSGSGQISTYILPESSERYLDYPDLEGIDGFELELARNEIYARHGRLFDTEEIQEYFDNCTWYNGTIAPEDFDESVLNQYEKANIDFILQKEYSTAGEE